MKVTYEPDNSIKKGYFFLLHEIFSELKNNRWLTYQLFKRDFLTTYKQSFIGIFWIFIIPFISIGTFVVLNHSGVLSISELTVPYPLYAIVGITFWQIFSTGVLASSNSLISAGSMLIKINFSKKSLVIASVGRALISFVIQTILIGFLFIYYSIMPRSTFFLLPIMAVPLFLLTLGLGFIFSLMNGVIRDIGSALSTLVTFLMFLTPILYPKPTNGMFASVTRYNILYYLISVPRDLLLVGSSSEWLEYISASVASCIIFMFCLIIFHLTETRVTERI